MAESSHGNCQKRAVAMKEEHDHEHKEKFSNGRLVPVDRFPLTKDSGIITIPLINPWPNIPLQTAGVITQATIRARFSTKRAAERTKVDGHVCERSRHDVATAQPSRELNIASRNAFWGSNHRAVVWDILPVST